MKKTFLYAVANGRNKGIYPTWDECNAQVKGFPSAKYKKFDNEIDAAAYILSQSCIDSPSISTVSFVPDYYVYTDGACINNGRSNAMAGYGIYFGENDRRNVSSRILGDKQTNNIAELTAILKTYVIIEPDILSGKKITIVSDSSYALRCVGDYGKKCSKEAWVKDIPNKELVRETYELYSRYPENIQFMYIAAHTGESDVHSLGNENADKLANQAIGCETCPYNPPFPKVEPNLM